MLDRRSMMNIKNKMMKKKKHVAIHILKFK